MDKESIKLKIRKIVEKNLKNSQVYDDDIINKMTIEDNVYNVLSSWELISILVDIEREFQIEISDEELLEFNTISELAEIIWLKQEGCKPV